MAEAAARLFARVR